MKNLMITFIVLFSSMTFDSFAQKKSDNSINIRTEKTEDGVKLITTKDGEESVAEINFKEIEKHLDKLDNLDIDIEHNENQDYKFTFTNTEGLQEEININISEIMEDISVDLEELEEGFSKMIDKITSNIEYNESIDENGNKSYSIKSNKKKVDK